MPPSATFLLHPQCLTRPHFHAKLQDHRARTAGHRSRLTTDNLWHSQPISVSIQGPATTKWSHCGPLSIAMPLAVCLVAGSANVPWLSTARAGPSVGGEAGPSAGLGRPRSHCWAGLQAGLQPVDRIEFLFNFWILMCTSTHKSLPCCHYHNNSLYTNLWS
jgi:hypothetical protein